MTLGGAIVGVTGVNSEASQKYETSPERPQNRMEGPQQAEKVIEAMSARDRYAQFFQQRFQVFLRTLLAVEARLVMQRLASAREL